MSLTTEQKAKAFDMFCNQVEQYIEDEIPSWMNENPYWEIDDEDCNGNRTFRCPPTTESDAREDLFASFVANGEDLTFGDFFEFVLFAQYGEAMSKDNKFRSILTPKTSTSNDRPKNDPVIEAMLKTQKYMLDGIFGERKNNNA